MATENIIMAMVKNGANRQVTAGILLLLFQLLTLEHYNGSLSCLLEVTSGIVAFFMNVFCCIRRLSMPQLLEALKWYTQPQNILFHSCWPKNT